MKNERKGRKVYREGGREEEKERKGGRKEGRKAGYREKCTLRIFTIHQTLATCLSWCYLI
jgi:hypothetical protein